MQTDNSTQQTARHNMVASQVRTNKVWDMKLVEVMEQVERERFVPDSHVSLAYFDEDIELGGGRIVMEPMVAGRLIQALEIDQNDVVMEVACGLSYNSAVMSKLAKTVIAVESSEEMAEEAQRRLVEGEHDNVAVIQADVTQGAGEAASIDAILINGAVDFVPDSLIALLAPRGKLACILRNEQGQSQAVLMQKFGESMSQRPLFDANVPALPEFRAEKGFSF